ncbi:MAG TPA: hypothetical protein VMG81_01945 [Thermoplasmata archaeon]|nr:hypothetical protein [Thermoplasmata archaeon]
MRAHRLRADRRAGVLLDLVLGVAFVIVGAFLLYAVGLTFGELLHGAAQFFGM